ncbi:MAG TPA: YigZ family protein [Thermoanaerobaculia bacterium]
MERSEFLGIAFPVSEEALFFDQLDAIAKEHFDATHHCWAFRLRPSPAAEPALSGAEGRHPLAQAGERSRGPSPRVSAERVAEGRARGGEFRESRSRSSDAGEPSGTAGRPILSAIEGADLCDVAVVVVRWFGGVKLGTGGLSRAYRETAAAVLSRATIVDHYVYDLVTVIAPFDRMSDIYRLVDPPNVVLVAERFGETNEFDFNVRRSRVEEFAAALRARRLTPR